MKKADVVELLRELPDEIDTEELIYRLYVKEKLDRAEAAVQAGEVVPHAEVIRISETWRR
jgi:hypothetical protein